MREAMLNGQIIEAGPHSPDIAKCPTCGGEVRKRKRQTGKGQYTYFYRHVRGVGSDCPLRYRPWRE